MRNSLYFIDFMPYIRNSSRLFQVRKKKKKCIFLDDEAMVEDKNASGSESYNSGSEPYNSSDIDFIDDAGVLPERMSFTMQKRAEVEINREKLIEFFNVADQEIIARMGLRFDYSTASDLF